MTASKRQVAGAHYAKLAIQPSEFIHRNGLGWCEGNAVKYVCRHRSKNGRQDIEKAIHYLQLLIEWEYPDAPATDSGYPALSCDGADIGGLFGAGARAACNHCEDD